MKYLHLLLGSLVILGVGKAFSDVQATDLSSHLEIVINKEIQFDEQSNGNGATWTHFRKGDDDGNPSRFNPWGYDSFGDPYCVLIIKSKLKFLDENGVLHPTTIADVKIDSLGNFFFEGGSLFCLKNSEAPVSERPSDDEIRSALGDYILLKSTEKK